MLLNNIRVIDLSQYIPGPYISRMLADLGAQVIKIEPPAGDPMRYFSSDTAISISDQYRTLNHGKKIVRLDLKKDEAMVKFKDLLAKADVLIDGFRPGALDRLGLNRDVITRINSNLIHCALTGFGQTGPLALKAGHDLGYCAVAGILGTGNKLKPPAITYPPLADHVGGLQASNSILAALYSRTQTGKGAFIDASLYEPILAWQYLVQSEHIAQVLGGDAAYYNVYQTRDQQYITLSALETKFWELFCVTVNKSQWIHRHSDDFPQSRLKEELAEFFNDRTQLQHNEMFADVDCCYEPIPEMDDIDTHPQTLSRGVINHYPNIIDSQRLASSDKLNEISEFENIDWD